MVIPNISSNAYNDAPRLSSNLFLGSLQLIFWLLFHPSAWRNQIINISSILRPDFCLAELSLNQWSNPLLKQFLIQSYLIWLLSLLVALLASLPLWGVASAIDDVAFFLTIDIAVGVILSIAHSVAAGVVSGLLMLSGVAIVIAHAQGSTLASVMVASLALSIAINIATNVATFQRSALLNGTMISPDFGQSLKPFRNRFIARFSNAQRSYSLGRQIGGISLGIFMGLVFSLIGGLALSFISRDIPLTITFSLVAVIAFSTAVGLRTQQWWRGSYFGLCFAVLGGIAVDTAYKASNVMLGIMAGTFLGIILSVILILSYAIAERIAGSWAGASASVSVTVGFLVTLTVFIFPKTYPYFVVIPLWFVVLLLGLNWHWCRPILTYPLVAAWNRLLYQIDTKRKVHHSSLLRYNSAFWDEHQWLPLLGLSSHIVLVAEHSPTEVQTAINYLSTSPQRWAVQAAQIELDARQLEHCVDTTAIGQIYQRLSAGELKSPANALFRSFNRISQDVSVALNQSSVYNQRLTLTAVGDRLDRLLRELTRSSDKYAVRFRPIAQHWSRIIALHLDELTKAAELRQEIDSPYIIGVPLTERQEIFVGRTDISSRIEQLLRDRRRPPLLLYGQRRTGKTSILNNLGRLLPSTVIPMFVDLQGPASRASDHAGFLYNLARGMTDSAKRQRSLILPALSRESLSEDPFTRFDEWLDEVDTQLQDNTVLLELDEFEALDQALAEGRFSETAVLGMLRNLIQHRPHFKVLLSGSHTLEEFQRWSSYLINVQVVHLGYLQDAEARQLIEHPVEGFALGYEPDASQRVLDLTHGHPFLVQLLCAEIVALKNEQDPSVRRLATMADVEAAIPEALSSGSMFFSDIERNQIDASTLGVLRYLAAQGEGATVSQTSLISQSPNCWGEAIDLLQRRELIELTPNGYRFQVELIRRWFTR